MFCTSLRVIKHTRKEHHCIYCNRVIPKGKPAYSWAYTDSNTMETLYACCPCQESYIIDVAEYNDGGEIFGDFYDRIQDIEFKCPVCGSKEREELDLEENIEIECVCGHKYTVKYGFDSKEENNGSQNTKGI